MAAKHMNTHSTNTTKLKVQVAPLVILACAPTSNSHRSPQRGARLRQTWY
jgi:hypothetical protein